VIRVTRITVILGDRIADRKIVKAIVKRTSERCLCADLIKIVWTDTSGHKHKRLVALEDISKEGACVQVECPLPIGMPVSILYPGGRYIGRIRYCTFQHTGYFLGVKFDPGYEWSRQQFMPSHLLEISPVRRKVRAQPAPRDRAGNS